MNCNRITNSLPEHAIKRHQRLHRRADTSSPPLNLCENPDRSVLGRAGNSTDSVEVSIWNFIQE
jgi:hypothetical protein